MLTHPNRGAIDYALNLGGRLLGKIPGFCWIERLKRSVSGIQILFLPPQPAAITQEV